MGRQDDITQMLVDWSGSNRRKWVRLEDVDLMTEVRVDDLRALDEAEHITD